MAEKDQAKSGLSARQKGMAVLLVVILGIIIWQIIGLFGGGGGGATAIAPADQTASATATPGAQQPPKMEIPKPAPVPPQPLTARDVYLQQNAQQSQDQYQLAVNELQVLKVKRDIANTNKDISSAQLAKVEAEKKIVDMLAPPPPVVAISPVQPVAVQETGGMGGGKYSVISVSQIQGEWSAVMSFKSTLYHVRVGDVLPPDGSKVVAIGKSGVRLRKDNEVRKVSMVPAL